MSQPPHPFLSRLRQQYFSLYPVRLIDFSPPLDSPLLLSLNQEWLIQSLLQVPRAPAWDYQKRFWKGMVEELEKEVRKPEAAESELVSTKFLLVVLKEDEAISCVLETRGRIRI